MTHSAALCTLQLLALSHSHLGSRRRRRRGRKVRLGLRLGGNGVVACVHGCRHHVPKPITNTVHTCLHYCAVCGRIRHSARPGFGKNLKAYVAAEAGELVSRALHVTCMHCSMPC